MTKKKRCTECWNYNPDNSSCIITKTEINPYLHKPCRKHDQMADLIIRERANAHERAKAKTLLEQADTASLEQMHHLPEWLKIGAEIVEVASGCEVVVVDIRPDQPDGIIYRATNRGDNCAELDERPDSIIERVTRGQLIVRGYTPDELKKGFRYSRIDYSCMDYSTTAIIWSDEPQLYGADDRLREKYEQLKPDWI